MCFRWFSKKEEPEQKPLSASNRQQESTLKAVHPAPSAKPRNDLAPLVLWWIEGKKTGYDPSINNFPRWFQAQYNLDFNIVLNDYLKKGFLRVLNNGRVILSNAGTVFLSENQHVVTIHKHPEYQLAPEDFTTNPRWHTVPNDDIIWGIFNKRQLDYVKSHKWDSLYHNYLNMSSLLVEEKKYSAALSLLFPAIFLATSGIHDNDKVNEYDLTHGFFDVLFLEINHYELSNPFRVILKNLDVPVTSLKNSFLNSKHVQGLKTILPFYYFDVNESWSFFEYAFATNEDRGIYSLADLNRASIRLKYNKPNPKSTTYLYANLENMLNAHFKK